MRTVILGALLLAAASLLPGTAAAEPATADQRAAFERLLQTAVDEHRVFLTCGALEQRTSEQIENNWREMVAKTVPLLIEAGYTPAEIIAFSDRTEPRNLVDEQRPFGDVISDCRSHTDWMRNLQLFKVVLLDREARKIFQAD